MPKKTYGFNSESVRMEFNAWLDEYMRKGNNDVPARLLTAMGLLERLRENPSVQPRDHTSDNGMQLEEHNGYVNRALERFELESPLRELGRRSSNLSAWIEPLFAWLKRNHMEQQDASSRSDFLTTLQSIIGDRLGVINEGKPLVARYSKGTAIAVIADLLDQAQEKNRAKDVAEYLVGAKLQLRFGDDAAIPKNVNTPNRNRPADFQIGDAAVEVTVNPPDQRHLAQVQRILQSTGLAVWLLVRRSDRERWQNVIDASIAMELSHRVAIADLEGFLGQNVSEIGRFVTVDVHAALNELFRLYNDRWLPALGASGLRITNDDPQHS